METRPFSALHDCIGFYVCGIHNHTQSGAFPRPDTLVSLSWLGRSKPDSLLEYLVGQSRQWDIDHLIHARVLRRGSLFCSVRDEG